MSIKDDYQEFKQALNDLKINSKPQINFLTILAEEKIVNGAQIVRAIEERIIELRGDAVLPVLYVLDSIVKNLRSSNYPQLFEQKLPVTFASAFNKVDERTRLAMYKLRQTWGPYFSNQALHDLDTRTHYIDPAWPITARHPDSSTVTNSQSNSNISQQRVTTPADRSDDNERSSTRVTASRDDNYNMIPIERIRPTVEHSSESSEQPPIKPSVINEKKDPRQAAAHHLDETKTTKVVELLINENSNTNDTTGDDVDDLFGGTDIDYRDTETSLPTKPTTTNPSSLDTDRIFELNNRCFSLAEEKYKSKELSTEEYQATLKLLQQILQSEAQRLIGNNVTTNSAPSFVNNPSTLTTNPTNPFPSQPFLPFPNQATNNSFPFAGFANETQRHVSQILATVGASVPYPPTFNFLSYIPPLPPAPPSFPLVPPAYPGSTAAAPVVAPTSVLYPGRQSPPVKRPHAETTSAENSNNDEEAKRQRIDLILASSHNFAEENIAPVPSLIDANITTLKKKYLGVIQQLYIGKFQCRACGLRFTSKQKDAYNHHLDWHFWENQQASAAAARFQSSRDWYPLLEEWMIYEEDLDEKIRNNQLLSKQNRHGKDNDQKEFSTNSVNDETSCPAKSNGDIDDDRCFVCHDPFENFFDHNREEWRLKDAIRINGKTYHPICYQDVQDQTSHERNPLLLAMQSIKSMDTSSQRNTTINSADSQTVEMAMATAKIKSEGEDSNDDDDDDEHSSNDETNKPPYLSSMSFVNLVETIYVKKEDLKQIENFETISTNIKEELIDPNNISEEIPFLSIKRESDCEYLLNSSADAIGTRSD